MVALAHGDTAPLRPGEADTLVHCDAESVFPAPATLNVARCEPLIEKNGESD